MKVGSLDWGSCVRPCVVVKGVQSRNELVGLLKVVGLTKVVEALQEAVGVLNLGARVCGKA